MGATGLQGPIGPTGAQGPAGAQGPTGPQGATGAQGPGGAAASVRAATFEECATGGAVIADDTNSVTVCNGAAGPAGATGATGPQGIQGIQGIQGPVGPEGPAGGAPIDEDTAVVAVTNLRVEIAGMPAFRPTAVSRIGIDMSTVYIPSSGQQAMGPPRFPAFKVMLGTDAPLNDLQTWWQQALNGQLSAKEVVVKIQLFDGGKSYIDASRIEIHDAVIVGFSNGAVSPASLTLQPSSLNTYAATPGVTPSGYAAIDMTVLPGTTLEFQGNSHRAGVNRIAGGDIELVVADSIGVTRDFGIVEQRLTDLKFTAVARLPALSKGQFDPLAFEPYYDWINGVITGNSNPAQTMVVTQYSTVTGNITATTTYDECLPVKINLVNPSLIEGGIAPWVFDMTVRPRPPQP